MSTPRPGDRPIFDTAEFLEAKKYYITHATYAPTTPDFTTEDRVAALDSDAKCGPVTAQVPDQSIAKNQKFKFTVIPGTLSVKISVQDADGQDVFVAPKIEKDCTKDKVELIACPESAKFNIGFNGKGHTIYTVINNVEMFWSLDPLAPINTHITLRPYAGDNSPVQAWVIRPH